MRRRPLLYRLIILAAIAVVAVAGYAWLVSHLAWKRDLQASGFIAELAPPGRGDRVLIVAPHPDDELLGCGGLIQQAIANGAEVHVVLMTNGDASELALILGERELPSTPAAFVNLGRKRQEESVRVLSSMGLPASHIHLLGFPNNGLVGLWRPEHWSYSNLYSSPYTHASYSPYARCSTPHAPYCGQQVLSDLMAVLLQVQPTAVYVTHPQDIHPDHWAACCFVRFALATIAARGANWAQDTSVYGYLVHWLRYPAPRRVMLRLRLLPPAELVAPDAQWVRLPLSGEEARGKLRAIRAYRSQGPNFDRLLLAFARANETFEYLPPVTVRPGGGRLWHNPASHRRGLGGVELARVHLAVARDGRLQADLAAAPHPIPRNAYIALDIRGWDDHGAPVIATVYDRGEAGAIARHLNAIDAPDPAAPLLRLGPGVFRITRVPLPDESRSWQQFFVTCWGSVRDRIVDPAVVSLVRVRPAPGEQLAP